MEKKYFSKAQIKLIVIVVFIFSGVLNLNAQCDSSQNIEQTSVNTSLLVLDESASGQSFETSCSGFIRAITIWSSSVASFGEATLTLYEGTSNTSVLGSQKFQIKAENEELRIEFPYLLEISENSIYTFLIEHDEGIYSEYQGTIGNTYANGSTWRYIDGDFIGAFADDVDYRFIVEFTDDLFPVIDCIGDVNVDSDSDDCGSNIIIPIPSFSDEYLTDSCFRADDIESLALGSIEGQSQYWKKFIPEAEAAEVSSEQAYSGSKSIKITGVPSGGPVDQVFMLGDLTKGVWEVSYWMYVPNGNTAFTNIQKFEDTNQWSHQIQFNSNGTADYNVGGTIEKFNYPQGEWFKVKHHIDLTNNIHNYSINNEVLISHPYNWQSYYTEGDSSIGRINFYATTNFLGNDPNPNAVPLFYVDDVSICTVPINNFNNSSDASGFYPIGETQVSWEITDPTGNTTNCITNVKVNDLPPSIICPENINAEADPWLCGTIVNYQLQFSDNCPIVTAEYSSEFTKIGELGGKKYYLSNNRFTGPEAYAHAIKNGGFMATIQSEEENNTLFNQISRIRPPRDVFIGYNDVVDEGIFVWQSGEPVNYTNWGGDEPNNSGDEDYVHFRDDRGWNDINASAENYYVLEIQSESSIVLKNGLPSGSIFPLGTTVNTYEITDSSGTTVSCSFNVTVEDTQAPVIKSPETIEIENPAGLCEVALDAPSDLIAQFDPLGFQNSGFLSPSFINSKVEVSNLTGPLLISENTNVLPIGIIPDGESPDLEKYLTFDIIPLNTINFDRIQYSKISYNNNGGTLASIRSSLDNFNSNITEIVVQKSAFLEELIFDLSSLPEISERITFRIYFYGAEVNRGGWNDIVSSAYGMNGLRVFSEYINPIVTDACSFILTNDYNNTDTLDGASFPVGETVVTWTAKDNFGNTSTSTTKVIVGNDTIDPIAQAKNINVELNHYGTVVIDPEDVNNGSSDSCGIASMSLDISTFECPTLGDHQVILTVFDAAGNSSSASATVTITASDTNNNGLADICEDADNDGIADIYDACPDTPNGIAVDANGCTILPIDNFSIETKSETCPDKDNGEILISSITPMPYVATINGVEYSFQNNLSVGDFKPGNYNICIEVIGVTSKYCYNVVIDEGTTLSAKSSITNNKATIQIDKGTAPFKIQINGKLMYETMDNSFEIAIKHGDLIQVKTSVDCEGEYSKKIELFDQVVAYPNPSAGNFEIAIPMTKSEVRIEIFNSNNQLISGKTYFSNYGKVTLDISNYPSGTYIAKLHLDKPVSLKLIKF